MITVHCLLEGEPPFSFSSKFRSPCWREIPHIMMLPPPYFVVFRMMNGVDLCSMFLHPCENPLKFQVVRQQNTQRDGYFANHCKYFFCLRQPFHGPTRANCWKHNFYCASEFFVCIFLLFTSFLFYSCGWTAHNVWIDLFFCYKKKVHPLSCCHKHIPSLMPYNLLPFEVQSWNGERHSDRSPERQKNKSHNFISLLCNLFLASLVDVHHKLLHKHFPRRFPLFFLRNNNGKCLGNMELQSEAGLHIFP